MSGEREVRREESFRDPAGKADAEPSLLRASRT